MPTVMIGRVAKWGLAAQMALAAPLGCDDGAGPAKEADADAPADPGAASTQTKEAAAAVPAPTATPRDASTDPGLDAAAELLDIDRVAAGVYRLPDATVNEVMFALASGAWTVTPGPDGIVLHTVGATRLAARLQLRDKDVLTGVGDLKVTETTGARAVFEAFELGEPVVTTWTREGRTRRALYRVNRSRPSRTRRDKSRAQDILRMAVTTEPKATVERAVLAAYAQEAEDADVGLLLEALGLPDAVVDAAIDGTSVVPDELARALGDKADDKSLELSINGQVLAIEIVPSTIDATDLADHIESRRLRPPLSRRFGDTGSTEDSPDPSAEPSGPTTQLPLDSAEATAGVTVEGDGKLSLDDKKLEEWLSDPGALSKAARIVPSQKDGVTQGYKLYGIRRGSIPKALGFKNGDMITGINGHRLTSVDEALEMYTKLRKAKSLQIDIVRKGKRHTLEIDVD